MVYQLEFVSLLLIKIEKGDNIFYFEELFNFLMVVM